MVDSLSLYVHVPFCTRKCGYCDFNSHAGQESLMPAYAEALVREARLWSPACRRFTVETVFFGGGTPSLMPLSLLAQVMDSLFDCFRHSDGAEVTLEANPGTVNEQYLSGLRSLGVNRLSLGVQSLDEAELAFLDRIHSAEEAREAYRAARRAGFDNVNLDLIFGLPRQRLATWRRSLEGALALDPEHLSLYALTVEEGTPLARYVAQGRVPAPNADVQAEMYIRTQERLARAGYEHYEISNWARPGFRCRHNLTYWRNGQWLGLGAGAHSHLTSNRKPGTGNKGARARLERSERFAVTASPGRYVELVNETWQRWPGEETPPLPPEAHPPLLGDAMRQITYREPADGPTAVADTLILGLRLLEGVDLHALERRFSADGGGEGALAPHEAAFEECRSLGLLERANGRLRLTDRGRLVANEVFVRLVPT